MKCWGCSTSTIFRSRTTLTRGDLEFLCAFANQAAIAIDNSILNEKLTAEAVTRNNLLRFFPPTAVPSIVHGSGAGLATIEREATVVFSDISDYTSMSSRMRPTQIIELLNAYFPVMAEIVFRYDGTLEKYIGDALLALWGVPLEHQDDTGPCSQGVDRYATRGGHFEP